jgi:hypothetical protein
MIYRYSSRRSPLKDFLAARLQDACRYDRIAGFFSSSLLEVAGDALERMKPEGGKACVRVVCNSCLNPLDVQTALAAEWGMHRKWRASVPVEIGPSKTAKTGMRGFVCAGKARRSWQWNGGQTSMRVPKSTPPMGTPAHISHEEKRINRGDGGIGHRLARIVS